MRFLFVFLVVIWSVSSADADADADSIGDLSAEHRSAKPEPFLDRIAALFSGNSEKSGGNNKKPPGGNNYQGAASVQRPIVRPPPPLPPRPPVLPQRPALPPRRPQRPYNTQPVAPSNNRPTFVAPGGSSFGAPPASPNDPWQIAQPASMAQIQDLQVQCEKDLMRVRIIFDRPFYGMVFSKGHYSNVNCVHVPSGLGQTSATFDISLQSCGMSSSVNDNYGSPTPQGSFIENTVIIQYDPLLQEVWDQARRLRCTWYDFYEKAVTFRPYQVDMLDPVTANFLGDNLRCWMQIQVGKGPHASEVSGIVKIGQTMTMVLGVKDDENKFDMMVRNCVAHDGTRAPIQLVDEKGCVSRPKIMSPFKKLKNFDSTANVLAYAYFQAFKFPDSMNVHFQCVVQVCRGACPEPQCGGQGPPPVLPSRPNSDGYGSPQAPALDSYGSPSGAPLGPGNPAINPRLPGGTGQTVYQGSGSEPRVTVVKSDGTKVPEPERLVLSEPGYGGFNKRTGLSPATLGGRPRSLELERSSHREEDKTRDAKNVLEDSVVNTVDAARGEDHEVKKSRRRRTLAEPCDKPVMRDANGNRILHVVKRDATEMAEVETTERIIQVLAPNDVQFRLDVRPEAESVVINTNKSPAESLCVDTAGFVGVTVTFLMILIVALITIMFLWHRIRSMDKKLLL